MLTKVIGIHSLILYLHRSANCAIGELNFVQMDFPAIDSLEGIYMSGTLFDEWISNVD